MVFEGYNDERDAYGTIPSAATAEGRERIPRDIVSAIITRALLAIDRRPPNITAGVHTHSTLPG